MMNQLKTTITLLPMVNLIALHIFLKLLLTTSNRAQPLDKVQVLKDPVCSTETTLYEALDLDFSTYGTIWMILTLKREINLYLISVKRSRKNSDLLGLFFKNNQ